MKKLKYFPDKEALIDLIEKYFEQSAANPAFKEKTLEPPTIAGLALYLGFNSKDDFDHYEETGRYASLIRRAGFRVMAHYESRLHHPAPTGAMFALKSMGWHERPKAVKPEPKIKSIKVKLINSGPPPVSAEKDVIL